MAYEYRLVQCTTAQRDAEVAKWTAQGWDLIWENPLSEPGRDLIFRRLKTPGGNYPTPTTVLTP